MEIFQKKLSMFVKVVLEKYGLLAIVVHSGSSLHYGHYFTYMRNETKETSDWYLANDSHLSQVSIERLMSKASTFKEDTPYIVFYERIKEDNDQTVPEFKVNANLLNLIEEDDRIFDIEEQEERAKASRAARINTKRDDDNDGANGGNGSNNDWNTGPNLIQ